VSRFSPPLVSKAGVFFGFPSANCCNRREIYAWGPNTAPANRTSAVPNSIGISNAGKRYLPHIETWPSSQIGTASLASQLSIRNLPWSSFASLGNEVGEISFVVLDDGRLMTQSNTNLAENYPNGVSSSSAWKHVLPDQRWKQVSGIWEHVLLLDQDDHLWAFGLNTAGQLGDGTTTNSIVAKQIGADTWQTVSAGYRTSLAINSSGHLYIWGSLSGKLSPYKMDGFVDSVTLTNGGSGYTGFFDPLVTASPPPAGGETATFTAFQTGGVVTDIYIRNPGYGYTTAPTITITSNESPPGSGATATATISQNKTWSYVSCGNGSYLAIDSLGKLYRANVYKASSANASSKDVYYEGSVSPFLLHDTQTHDFSKAVLTDDLVPVVFAITDAGELLSASTFNYSAARIGRTYTGDAHPFGQVATSVSDVAAFAGSCLYLANDKKLKVVGVYTEGNLGDNTAVAAQLGTKDWLKVHAGHRYFVARKDGPYCDAE